MSDQIATLPRNSKEKIVFSLNEFKGRHYLDMRIFTAPENGGQDIPTKKGITLSVDLYPQFRKALAPLSQRQPKRPTTRGQKQANPCCIGGCQAPDVG